MGHKFSELIKKIVDRKASPLITFTTINNENKKSMIAPSYVEPASMVFNDVHQQNSALCLYSGCTSHMCTDRKFFTEFYLLLVLILQ